MNILALDYGRKNIGLAWCQEALGVVLPYGKIINHKSKIKNFIDLIKKERIDLVVIGLPLGLDGKENENTKNVRAFGEVLKSEVRVPISYVDERFSSHAADRFGAEGASRDEKAAMVILQGYLDSRKKS